MAARSRDPERPRFFRQLKSLYTFTQAEYTWLPWMLAGIVVVVAGIGVLVGFLLQPFSAWTVVLWGITGLLAGVLLALIGMTRLSTRAMYAKLDGMPGGAGHVLSNYLGRNWQSGDAPVGVNPRTQEAVYRAVGRGGVVVVGEGARGRLTRLVNEERSKAQRVAQGVPVTVIYVGHDEGDVPIDKLAKTIKSLPKKIDKTTMAAVIKRIDSVSQSLASLPIPKGVDPTKVRAPRPR